MRMLKYTPPIDAEPNPQIKHRIEQLVMLAKALANEIETLQTEISTNGNHGRQINDGIDFYDEVERYEIELIKDALKQSNGNQTQAARLLKMKTTTLNAKMKHYGLNPVRPIMLQRANEQTK